MPSEVAPPLILIADDHPDVLDALRLLLKGEGFQVRTAQTPSQVVRLVEDGEFDAALLDLNYARDTTSGEEGLDLIEQLQQLDPILPVVVMTAWSSVELAVEAMRRGARDFVEKPWENERLVSTLSTQVALARALRHGHRLEAENRLLRADASPDLIATSKAMQPVLELIDKVGPSDANVLITGEHGTGKDVVARRLHAVSARAEQALIVVNVGGLAEGVFASELFGHVRGAYTDAKSDRVGRFEMADGGTLFLDEIANVPVGRTVEAAARARDRRDRAGGLVEDQSGRRAGAVGHQRRHHRRDRRRPVPRGPALPSQYGPHSPAGAA